MIIKNDIIVNYKVISGIILILKNKFVHIEVKIGLVVTLGCKRGIETGGLISDWTGSFSGLAADETTNAFYGAD